MASFQWVVHVVGLRKTLVTPPDLSGWYEASCSYCPKDSFFSEAINTAMVGSFGEVGVC